MLYIKTLNAELEYYQKRLRTADAEGRGVVQQEIRFIKRDILRESEKNRALDKVTV